MIDISVLWNQTGHTGQIKHVSFPSCTLCPMLKGQHDVKLTELMESLVVFELGRSSVLADPVIKKDALIWNNLFLPQIIKRGH